MEIQRLELQLREGKNSDDSVKPSINFYSKVEIQILMPKFDVKGDDISLLQERFKLQEKVLKIPKQKWVTQLYAVLPS